MAIVTIGGRSYEVELRGDIVVVDGEEFPIVVKRGDEYATVSAGRVDYRVATPPEGERHSGMTIEVDHRPLTFEYEGQLGGGPARARGKRESVGRSPAPARASVAGGVTAQLSGKVLRVDVKIGDNVVSGQLLLVLEAMKMENEINAPQDGTVKEVLIAEGAQVAEGDTLMVIE